VLDPDTQWKTNEQLNGFRSALFKVQLLNEKKNNLG
jgi:hypothetical protein